MESGSQLNNGGSLLPDKRIVEAAFAAVLIAVLQFFTQGSAFFFIIFLCGDYQSRKPNRNTKLRFLVDHYSLLILHRVAGHKVSKARFPEGVYIYLNPIYFFKCS